MERSAAATTVAEGLTRVRAAQAAFFASGWHLRISAPHLMASLTATVTGRFNADDWIALRAYRAPYRPALVALHQAGIPLDDLMCITVGEIADAIDTGQLVDFRFVDEAIPFLTAQLLQRAIDRARPHEPFIVGSDRLPAIVINGVARDLGLLIGTFRAPTNPHRLNFWQFRTGLLLKRL
jgi:hypothetical protein